MKCSALFLVLGVLGSVVAHADDKSAQAVYDKAKAKFDSCTELAPSELTQAMACVDNDVIKPLDSTDAQAQDTDIQYNILVLASRAQCWKGGHTDGDDNKKPIFELGQKKADGAKKINGEYAEAYFWGGLNLARWAEANGVLSSLFKKNELIKAMNDAIERVTQDGQPGETIEGYAPDRILGRMYFKLPGFAGGDHDKSVKYLQMTYDKAKDYAINVQFLAETLADGNSTEKAKARQILDLMLSQDPTKYNPSRLQETISEFEDARKLRKDMGDK